jgi:plastocyanin
MGRGVRIMNQKPLLYALVATLVVVLVGFIYLAVFANRPVVTPPSGGRVVVTPKATLPPEPESPRVFTTPVQTGTEAGATKPKIAQMARVSITSAGFTPEEVTISPGDLVTWTNNDRVAHIVRGRSWGSGSLDPAKAFTQEFDVAGTFSYSDEANPNFTGRVVVK